MIKIEKNKLIEAQNNSKPIVYDLFYKATDEPLPVVIFCHGYKGFKDWGAWDLVAKKFAEAGFFFLKFNFSHNGGTVAQPIDFPDLEAFAENNYSKELDDLDSVITHISCNLSNDYPLDLKNISLIGHSRGGGIVLVKAEEDDRIQKVSTWAGVSDFKVRFREGSSDFLAWKKTGRYYVLNGRTKQKMPHNWQFYEDFLANEERLTIERAVKNLVKPCLIVHGEKDTSVLKEEALQLQAWNPEANLLLIEEADHVFEARHPWDKEKLSAQLLEVTQKTCSFFINPLH